MEQQTFIDNIPGVALPLVVSNHISDMILHGRQKGRIGP
jgi:hypothetical protein